MNRRQFIEASLACSLLALGSRRSCRASETDDSGLELSPGYVARRVAWFADGKRIVTAGTANWATVWDARTGKELHRLKVPEERRSIWGASVSPDGKVVALCGDNKILSLWDAESGKEIHSLTFDTSLNDLAFSPDGKFIYVAAATIFVYDVTNRRIIGSFDKLVAGSRHLAVSNDGKLLACAGGDGSLTLWDAARRIQVAMVSQLERGDYFRSISVSPDGKNVAASSNESEPSVGFRIWNVETLKVTRRLDQVEFSGRAVGFHPKEPVLAVASGRSVVLYDIARGKRLSESTVQGATITSLQWSPDGTKLLTAGDDHRAYVTTLDRLTKGGTLRASSTQRSE